MELRGKNQLKAEPVHAKQTGCLGNYECALSAWMAPAATIFHEAFLSFSISNHRILIFCWSNIPKCESPRENIKYCLAVFRPPALTPTLVLPKKLGRICWHPPGPLRKKILQTVLDPFPHCVTNTFFILTELKKYKKRTKSFFSVYFCILGPKNLCSVPSYTLSSYCTLSMRSGYFRNWE